MNWGISSERGSSFQWQMLSGWRCFVRATYLPAGLNLGMFNSCGRNSRDSETWVTLERGKPEAMESIRLCAHAGCSRSWLTNAGPSLFPLDAVEETKPTESAQQEEVKEEESKADQENAWTLRNYSPLPLPPSPYPLSFLPNPISIFPLPAHICEPVSVPLPLPLKPFFSLCGKHLKKKKKAGKIPVKQCGLNISLFLGVVMASFW